MTWYSIDNLRRAWRFAKIDQKDDFVFDIINHDDVKISIENVLETIHAQLRDGQYYPAPVLCIAVPKNDYSTRPGTTIPLIDLIVLYAIVQQLAPALDQCLPDSAYAYRLNPRANEREQPLFDAKEAPAERQRREQEELDEEADDADFPYDWFDNWRRFRVAILQAVERYEFVAITDITAFFENISQSILFDRIRELLGPGYRDLVTRLVSLMQLWNWNFTDDKGDEKGLPQGNDVSAFLSNLYLLDLDRAMLAVVNNDVTKYVRYVDDVQLYTSNRDEARRALIELESVLRSLCLNVQSSKTKIRPSFEAFDQEVEQWLDGLSDEAQDRLERAQQFLTENFDSGNAECVARWERVYRRSLTVLARTRDPLAVDIARGLFLSQPNSRLLLKNYNYLREFVGDQTYEEAIYSRLTSNEFTFDFHRAYMYRLATYSRGEHPQLRQLALSEATDSQSFWLCRAAALGYLSTHSLSRQELADVSRILSSEGNAQVVRAAFVTLAQHGGDEFEWVLNQLSFFNAPHQEHLKQYFRRLSQREQAGQRTISDVRGASLNAPVFIHHLHRLDLLKANRQVRTQFRELIGQKITDCNQNWPRLLTRLDGIQQTFIDNP